MSETLTSIRTSETQPGEQAATDRGGWRTQCASVLAALVIWEVVARLAASPALPTASDVLAALVSMIASGEILGNLAVSLRALAAGYAAAAVAGVALGAAMGRFRAVEVALSPYVNAFLASPSLIFVPVLFTLFGAGRMTQAGAVFLHAVFVIVVTTHAGVRNARGSLLEMASAFGATERQIFWKIRLPQARPAIVSGLRLGVPLAVKGMVNGEMFIAFLGLGALVRSYGGRFEPDKVLAIVFVVICVSLAGTTLVDALDRRMWRAT